MATSEERLKILKMIQEGKISAEQGMQLLESLVQSTRPGPQASRFDQLPNPPPPGRAARWFRVRVTDMDTGRVRVNIRMPINVITTGFKLGARFSPEVEGLDMTQLMEAIRAGETGQIVDVVDKDDGEHVEVFLE
jgi:hypothetical protein